MARYDYDRPYRRRPEPPAYGWYPGAFWGGAPIYGWGMWEPGWGWPPPPPPEYFEALHPPRPPERSPTYGRGGDRAAREWARRAGYDEGYAIPPRRAAPPPRRERYDRGWYDLWW